jgi:hypothetical protein
MTDKYCETCGEPIDPSDGYVMEECSPNDLYWHDDCFTVTEYYDG